MKAILSLLLFAKQTLSSEWDYTHMSEWSHHFSMCDNVDQSPINILASEATYDEDVCHTFFDWDVENSYTDFKVTNNGHSIVLQAVQESSIDPDGDLSSTLFDSEGQEYQVLGTNEDAIAHFPNYFQPEHSPHEEFCLHSLHFHWGLTDAKGSEHFVDGHQYALEAHFVHYSCHHASLATTLAQFPNEGNVTAFEADGSDSHQLGVVGIFFDVEDDYVNPAFEALLSEDVLDSVEFPGHDTTFVHEFDLDDLIPENLKIDGYFAYEGSLTTPPCTDIVRWHVMNARGKIGTDQMAKFRHLMASAGVQSAPNYREIQSSYHTVYGCMDQPDSATDEDAASTERIIVWIVAVFALLAPVVMGVICCRRAKKEIRDGHNSNMNTHKTPPKH